MAPKKGETSQQTKGKGKARLRAILDRESDSENVDEDLGVVGEPSPTPTKVVPTKVASPQQGKGSSSRRSKGKEQEREQTPISDGYSDSDYRVEDDLPIFEDLEYTTPNPSSKRKKLSSIFFNEEARDRWEMGMATKLFHLERGFTVDEGSFAPIMEFHNFDKKLTTAPTHCNASLVREFYANAKFPNANGTYYVRGQWVQITSELINAILRTKNHQSNPVHYPKNAELDESMLNELALPGEEWVLNKKGAHLYIRWESLRSDVKIWYKFVLARLMPNIQTTSVNRRSLFLLSTIIGRRHIDAGRVILASIKIGIERDNAPLFFPLLIEELCAAQGVDIKAGEWRPTPEPIGNLIYQKYVSIEKDFLQACLALDAGQHNQQAFNFQGFDGVLRGIQQSVTNGFRLMDERLERMEEREDNRYQEVIGRIDGLSSRVDDVSSFAQQHFEVLYHRQMMLHAELDKCNKMAVYYHSSPELPKSIPTQAQLKGCQVPHLSSNVVSGEVQEIPPEVAAIPSFAPLPTFGSLTHIPTPAFVPNPSLMPGERIPYIASGQPLHGAHLGLTWKTSSLAGVSFPSAAAFSPPSTFAPSSTSQGASPP